MPAPEPMSLLDSTAISASGTGTAKSGLGRYKGFLGIMSVTAAPSGGAPTLDVYIQATPDGGTTWQDVAAFRFTGVAIRTFQLSQLATPGTATLAASDGALASNTSIQGPIGDQLRVKYTFAAGGSTGTFTASVKLTPVGGP